MSWHQQSFVDCHALYDPFLLIPYPTLPGAPEGKTELTWLSPGSCAEVTGVIPKRATEVWRWGRFSLRATTIPDG